MLEGPGPGTRKRRLTGSSATDTTLSAGLEDLTVSEGAGEPLARLAACTASGAMAACSRQTGKSGGLGGGGGRWRRRPASPERRPGGCTDSHLAGAHRDHDLRLASTLAHGATLLLATSGRWPQPLLWLPFVCAVVAGRASDPNGLRGRPGVGGWPAAGVWGSERAHKLPCRLCVRRIELAGRCQRLIWARHRHRHTG